MTAKATCNGNITAIGGENCTSRGFEWGLVQGGPYGNSWTENGDFGTGTFSHEFTGLVENTVHYYRAKAYNSAGWGYGGEQSFTTWKAVNAPDTGSGTEAPGISAQIAYTETGAGVESTPTPQGQISLTDLGAATESALLEGSQTLSDIGTGIEVPIIDSTATVTISDSGAGVESLVTVTASFTISDVGADVDAITIELPIIDAGSGADVWGLATSFTATDSASGIETWGETASFTISDFASGTDVRSVTATFSIFDVGSGIDSLNILLPPLTITDTGFGVDITYRVQGQLLIDDAPLPHIDSLDIAEPSIMLSKPRTTGVPERLWRGKRGREVAIKGRTDTVAEIEAIKALNDGEPHLLILPTGDSFYVLVLEAKPDNTVESPSQIAYAITAKEVTT